MTITTKTLRAAALVLSCAAWLGYMLDTADIPPKIDLSNLYIFSALFFVIILISAADLILSLTKGQRGGYFSIVFDAILLIVWIYSYKGANFNIGNTGANRIALYILYGGIISSTVQTAAQLTALVNSAIRKAAEIQVYLG